MENESTGIESKSMRMGMGKPSLLKELQHFADSACCVDCICTCGTRGNLPARSIRMERLDWRKKL